MANAKLYKLTDTEGCTHGGPVTLQWGEGVTHTCARPGEPPVLCTGSVIHAYESPLVAVLMDPIYGHYGATARLWEAEGDVAVREGPLKCGVRELTTRREIPLPALTTEQRVEVAIRCALTVCRAPSWVAWAEAWLSGSARSAAEAAWEAATAAWAAEARSATARAAAWAAEAAARSAAAWAAQAVEAAWAAEAAPLDLHVIIAGVLARAEEVAS